MAVAVSSQEDSMASMVMGRLGFMGVGCFMGRWIMKLSENRKYDPEVILGTKLLLRSQAKQFFELI